MISSIEYLLNKNILESSAADHAVAKSGFYYDIFFFNCGAFFLVRKKERKEEVGGRSFIFWGGATSWSQWKDICPGSSDDEILFAVAPWQGIPQLLPKSLRRAGAALAPSEAPEPCQNFSRPPDDSPALSSGRVVGAAAQGRSITEVCEEKKWGKRSILKSKRGKRDK